MPVLYTILGIAISICLIYIIGIINFKDNVNARLNFNQFYHYMKRTYASDEIAVKVQKIQRILGKNLEKK